MDRIESERILEWESVRLLEKARHDEAQALYNARQQEKFETARNALKENLSVSMIAKLIGLSTEEINALKN